MKAGAMRGLVLAGVLLSLAMAGCRSTGSGAGPGEGGVTGSEFDDGAMTGTNDQAGQRGRAIGLETVYFDFDSFQIREDAKPLLKGNAQTITGKPQWPAIVIEGHCDERGSDEQNLALAERGRQQGRRHLRCP